MISTNSRIGVDCTSMIGQIWLGDFNSAKHSRPNVSGFRGSLHNDLPIQSPGSSDVVFGAFIGVFTALWVYKYFFGKDSDSSS